MFTPPFTWPDGKPIYPEMDRDTVLFGGTDPGRFNPTYMIFCESFIPPEKKPRDPKFDRRDVYLITQNALADGTYLNYIRAHYNRSTEIDPPFFSELMRGPNEQASAYPKTNIIARAMVPLDRFFLNLGDNIEKRRRAGTSFFTESDFKDLPGFAGKLQKCGDPVSKFVYENLSKETQGLLGGGGSSDQSALRKALAKDLNKFLDREVETYNEAVQKAEERNTLEKELSGKEPLAPEVMTAKKSRKEALDKELAELAKVAPFYTPERFQGVTLSDHAARFAKEDPRSHTRIRWDRLLLESAYPKEIATSIGGVYPDLEIHTPSNEDSQRSFQEYLGDAQRRLDHDHRFPNEPKQIKPGEDVRVVDNRVQVSGQVAVMAINGLLTKIIFDKNPDHEFYVEESFPLDWMYPHLTPYGIIMKINRQPLTELGDDVIKKDHEFWSQFSQRLIGNWITYDTPISKICEWAEKIYNRRDYKGFTGDPKFIRDNDGQKAFSKLRSSIAGVYNYRIQAAKSVPEQQRMIKEAEFAFKQAYAFCPYSPEAVFRYINLLISMGRVEDARLMAVTSLKLDPNNGQMEALVGQLEAMKQQTQGGMPSQIPPPAASSVPTISLEVPELEKQTAADPKNLQAASKLLMDYVQMQQTPKALELVDKLTTNAQADANTLLFVANIANQLNQLLRVEKALGRLVKLTPENPELWFDLAAVQTLNGKAPEAIASLRSSLQTSARRLATNSSARNLYNDASNDARLNTLRSRPEFQKLLSEFKPAG
jgi:thioredoxin-like negative regulator of GroEL